MLFNDLMRRVKRIEAEVAKMYGVHPSKVSMYSLEDIRRTADWKYIVEHFDLSDDFKKYFKEEISNATKKLQCSCR